MANTVPTPVSDRSLGRVEDLLPWANKEVVPILREARTALNASQVSRAEGDTSDSIGVLKVAWESDTAPTTGVWAIDARVVLADASNQGAVYRLAVTFRMVAGVPTTVSSTAYVSQESAGAFDWQWNVTVDNTVTLSVRDNGVAATYSIVIELVEVIP